jgi:TonB-dependent starch-binding outer membrane protein SusC
MKTILKKLLLLLLLLPIAALSQDVLTGNLLDGNNSKPLPGVNVNIKNSPGGVSTDFDGSFKITNLKVGDVVVFSYIGYKSEILTYSGQKNVKIYLTDEQNSLKEVVVQVGYGSVKKKDATGSVSLITSKDFNKGAIISVDQLLTGKAAGVRITSAGGSPDAAPNIRIRGGSSLSNNNPLIVIDGIPIADDNPAGISNPLSLVNPNDVESFSILKDASATAIYGIRGSNGVIIITTKKGSSGATPQFTFSSSFTVGKVDKKVNVLSGSEYVEFIKQYYPSRVNDLGIQDPAFPADPTKRIISNTDWQDQIYRTSVSNDFNFSARANLYKQIPFRASIGYNNTKGLVKTSDYERFTYSLKMTPKFLNDHLKIDINAKGTLTNKNAIDEGGAIGGAASFDPTKPVFGTSTNGQNFGGYYQNTVLNGNFYKLDGNTNPLALLEQRTRPERVLRFLGNIELDYKLHFFPSLRAVVNLGLDASQSRIKEFYKDNAIASYQFNQSISNPNTNFLFNPGLNLEENQTVTNKTMDAYLVYSKTLSGLLSKFDIQGGYTYQDFKTDGNKGNYRYNNVTGVREVNLDPQNITNRYFFETNTQALFARTNLDFKNKYLFTFSLRREGLSFFRGSDNIWGVFPSAAFAWKIKEESFLKNANFVQDLKLRLGYGKVGNGRISDLVGYYPASPIFNINNGNSQYLPGTATYSAIAFNPNITWEKTSTLNAGLDFEFFKKSAISGSFDIYNRKTNDLLAVVNVPPGQGLSNVSIGNVGNIDGKGFELNLTIKPIQTDNVNLSINGNVAYNYSKVTELVGTDRVIAKDGGLPTQTGVQLVYNAVGYQPFSALVFEQIYDKNGLPIAAAFVDRNGDGTINNSDRYFKAIRPNWTFGFGFNFNYKNWDLSTSFRGQKGGQVYNANKVKSGFTSRAVQGTTNALNNVLNFSEGTGLFSSYNGNDALSDYLLEDATFVRCENVTLAYKFGKLKFIKNSNLRVYASANNLFIVTKYKGQDPENFNGIDNNFYPRPKMYTFGLSLDF